MRRRKRAPQTPQTVAMELCDLCGAVVPKDRTVSEYVPDSSSAQPAGDWFDGLRLITACTDAHLEELREHYRRRPFVDEELAAAKIGRALSTSLPGLTMDQLGCRTGLDEPDIRRAIAWHNAQLRERHVGS
ncbi:hypothetical protein ACFY93_10160 [Streptomyces sp. NPDC008313]|uniref:hypothetical protein n=1 Tax=Streptomyces sp. NPDC008313 TaxID=3364826 RepID=UPI0036DFB346